MIPQIIYVLIASDKNYYLEELWASLFSLRRFHKDACVKCLCDADTAKRVREHKALADMLTEIVVVDVPQHYNGKQRSRQIKTIVREIVSGDYLFIDTDTIICQSLDGVEDVDADIAAVPDEHVPLKEHPFGAFTVSEVKRIFDVDISDSEWWFNSGVMFVRDTPIAHQLYKRWNENWTYSCFEKGNSQDQPALVKTDKEFGYIIRRLPDVYNCQIAMSIKYLHEARIMHFWHMNFIENQDYSPFMGLDVYRCIRQQNGISEDVEQLIVNCKSSFASATMIVGREQIYFLFSIAGQVFTRIHQHSRIGCATLNYIARQLNLFYRAKRKFRRWLNEHKKV